MKGFVIAKPTKDAFTANSEDDYVNTANPILKVLDIQRGSVTMTAADATTPGITVKVPYSLNYKPFIQVFAERKPPGNFRIVLSSNQTITTDVIYVISYVEDNSFSIKFVSLGGDPTGVYRYVYYIFGDESEIDG
jgi:hypothetical protein